MPIAAASRTIASGLEEKAGSGRLVSLDLFRGLTVAGMILVTDPGMYGVSYAQLSHAAWNGATTTDMIFPSFLVAVGIALTLSLASRRRAGVSLARLIGQVLRRTVLLILLGLVVNWYPDFDLHTIRIAGILQRIGLCYLMASSLYLAADWLAMRTGRRGMRPGLLVVVGFAILAGYGVLLKSYPVPGFGPGRMDSLGNLAAVLDRAVIGVRHMWAWGLTPGYGVTYDPEGVLSTFPALATTLVGVLAGMWLQSARPAGRKALGIAMAGVLLVGAGLAWSPWLTINKRIWTSSFALLSGGVALLVFTGWYAAFDIEVRVRERARGSVWLTPLLVFGTNAILAFCVSQVVTGELARRRAGGFRASEWVYGRWFSTWLQPADASLAYALTIVAFNALLIWPLYRRRIFLRL